MSAIHALLWKAELIALYRIVFRIPPLVRPYYKFQYRKWDRASGGPILAYQMAKVGSSTVVKSIRRMNLKRPVFHVHTLDRASIEKRLATRQRRADPEAWESLYILDRMSSASPNHKWTVITLVREPVSRNISDFFHNLNNRDPALYRRLSDPELRIEEVHRGFLEQHIHQIPHRWFDVELKAVMGVDVYAGEFPVDRGYKIYEEGRARVLLMRMEDLNAIASTAFDEFLGLGRLKLDLENIGSKKSYARVYSRFLATFRPPASYLDSMYESKYARHFYSGEEIRTYRARWEGASE